MTILSILFIIMLIIIIIPFIALMLSSLLLTLFGIYLSTKTITFIGIPLITLGIFILLLMLIIMFIKLLLHKKHFKVPVIIISISIVLIILGLLITIVNVLNMTKISYTPIDKKVITETDKYIDNLAYYTDPDGTTINYVIDDTMEDVTLTVEYDKKLANVNITGEGNNHYISIDNKFTKKRFNTLINEIINNVRDNKLITNYNNIFNITITSNEENIKNIIKNQSSVKHVTYYKKTNKGYVVILSKQVLDNEECLLNKNNYYECKIKEES